MGLAHCSYACMLAKGFDVHRTIEVGKVTMHSGLARCLSSKCEQKWNHKCIHWPYVVATLPPRLSTPIAAYPPAFGLFGSLWLWKMTRYVLEGGWLWYLSAED